MRARLTLHPPAIIRVGSHPPVSAPHAASAAALLPLIHRGVKVVALGLRDAGFEVIYTGLHKVPEDVAEIALQEDVDAVGLSLLSGAHLTLFPRVMAELRDRGLGDVLVFGGGVIPDSDARHLREQGVAEIFGPGSSLKAISQWLETSLDAREEGS